MGECLRAGKPSWDKTGKLGRLSFLLFLRDGKMSIDFWATVNVVQ